EEQCRTMPPKRHEAIALLLRSNTNFSSAGTVSQTGAVPQKSKPLVDIMATRGYCPPAVCWLLADGTRFTRRKLVWGAPDSLSGLNRGRGEAALPRLFRAKTTHVIQLA